jgi:DNA-binding CsgD family transcriptional regulator
MLDPLQTAVVAASEAVTLRDLVDGALPVLQRAVGASNALVYRYGAGGVLETVGGSLAGEMRGYTRDLLGRDPLQGPPRRMEPGLKVVMITRDADIRRAFRRSDAYHEFYRPHDLEHVTCAWLSSAAHYGEPGMTGVLFGRAATEEPFSERDGCALWEALPALAAAVRRSERVAAALEACSALEAVAAASVKRPLCAFSTAGALRWSSSLAGALLGPSGLPPPALVAEARRLGALAGGGDTAGKLPAVCRVFVLPGGSAVRAELFIARTAGGEVVVLAELSPAGGPKAEPPALARARREALAPLAQEHGLTRAELDVLSVLAMGLTNREIGARLFVSVETVRTHVARILRKTGASTRAQAAVMAREQMG